MLSLRWVIERLSPISFFLYVPDFFILIYHFFVVINFNSL
nr:MAG TPA: hypothetical protein [Caudoviricetes sp.]